MAKPITIIITTETIDILAKRAMFLYNERGKVIRSVAVVMINSRRTTTDLDEIPVTLMRTLVNVSPTMIL